MAQPWHLEKTASKARKTSCCVSRCRGATSGGGGGDGIIIVVTIVIIVTVVVIVVAVPALQQSPSAFRDQGYQIILASTG